MKKITILFCILFINCSLWAQSDYPDVKTIFSNKQDIDFKLMKNKWEEEIKYYLNHDTLYYTGNIIQNYEISLQDIRLDPLKIVPDTVYKTKNGNPAYCLNLFAKEGKRFYYSSSFSIFNHGKSDIDRNSFYFPKSLCLVFPDKEYAEKVKEYLFNRVEPNKNKDISSPNQFSIFNSDLFSNLDTKKPSYEEPSYEELCGVTTAMINDLQNYQLRNYIGSIESSQTFYGMVLRKFNSKTKFPKAVKTLISDTTALQKFRSVEILMAEETGTDQEISQAMYDYYANIGGLLTSCLEQNKVTCDLNDPDPFNRSLMRTACSLQLTISQNSTINLLTIGSTLVVELTITQTDNKNGNFTTQMNIKIMKV